jgi:hypothetical protein
MTVPAALLQLRLSCGSGQAGPQHSCAASIDVWQVAEVTLLLAGDAGLIVPTGLQQSPSQRQLPTPLWQAPCRTAVR